MTWRGLGPTFPNPAVAESLLDRLINASHHIQMNGPSNRPNKRPGRVPLDPKERHPSRTTTTGRAPGNNLIAALGDYVVADAVTSGDPWSTHHRYAVSTSSTSLRGPVCSTG